LGRTLELWKNLKGAFIAFGLNKLATSLCEVEVRANVRDKYEGNQNRIDHKTTYSSVQGSKSD